ncbi:ABC transporter permease [Massilia sp. TWP1-3-3]|uniref:ABC transporter permease n=1 Tax=Massilia sp. TWP1-3-3 TaxID=2804573 RepID=UPI003CE95936
MNRSWLGLPAHSLVAEAYEALADNRLRSALSLLGVAIGIASIIVVSSIASSGRDMVFRELETFGLKTIWVFRSFAGEDRLEKDAVGSGISSADYRQLLRDGKGVLGRLSPVVEMPGEKVVAAKNGKTARVRLQGVSHDFDVIDGDETASGRFLTEDDISARLNVAVIGSAVGEKLFPERAGDLVGQKFTLGDQWFEVVGVLREKSRDLITSIGAGRGEETGARILIPYTTRQKMMGDSDFVSYLQGQAMDLNRSDEAIAHIVDTLSASHRGAFRYKGESMASYVATANKILGGVALIGIVAAGVSLLVGGLAIMNIMSTSVIERTREIGVRRAIGAPQVAIRAQFLTEAVLISSIGGAIGIVLGIGVVRLISAVSSLLVNISFDGLLLAILSTLAVGVASGYYPALTASRLAPVEALRHE